MADDAQGHTLLATPVPKTPADDHEAKLTTPTSDSLIGKVLVGRYKIERKLGEGGMGSVYIAEHTTLEKPVAIKILHGEYARKADLIERFLQEARSASKIRHENVIDITDFGTTDDGLVFFCMELLDGQDLHELLTRAKIEGAPMPWSRTAPIFLQVCAALHAAHSVGVIHRDLKPENIFLIDWLGNPDFVKLLDFGIAKMTSVEGEDGDRKLTKTGMLFGTPEYMSPEQARGDKPDARVDVYAMGCILYQLVVGTTPFAGDSFMAVLSQHLTAEPPAVTPQQLAAVGAPASLAAVIARSLLKDREARHGSIKELADAVRQICSGMALPSSTGTHQVPAEIAEAAPVPVSRKSEWTGSARLHAQPAPTVKADTGDGSRAKTAKLLWLAVAAVVLLGGGAAAAIALGGGGGSDDATAEPEQPAITAPDPGEVVAEPTPTPDPIPEPAVEPAADVEAATRARADRPTEASGITETNGATKVPASTEVKADKPVETAVTPVTPETCPAGKQLNAAKTRCVAKPVKPVETETETEVTPGEVKTKNPFDD